METGIAVRRSGEGYELPRVWRGASVTEQEEAA